MQEQKTFILPQTVQFGYHNVCETSMKLTENDIGAEKIYMVKDNGVMYSALPLKGTAEFEVTITQYSQAWNTSLCVGVARYITGQSIQVDQIPSDSSNGTNNCVWRRHHIYNNLTLKKEFKFTRDLDSLKKGDRVGLRLGYDGKLEFFVNGRNQGVAAENVYEEGFDVYAVVDHYACCCATAITRAVSAPLLHSAALYGDMDKLRELLESNKYDINSTDSIGRTPLHYVCANGKIDAANTLLAEFMSDVSCIDSMGQTPLHCACANGQEGVVKLILSSYKDEMAILDVNGNTALMLAALAGHKSLVHTMLGEYKCPIDARDQVTLLHLACEWGNLSLVRILIREYNADVNGQDTEKFTPLHVAARHGREKIALALINEFGCDIKVRGIRNRSVLHTACAYMHTDIVRSIGKYMSVLAADDNGDTPLHTCSALSDSKSIKALLHLNAPVLARNNAGKTPKEVAKLDSIRDLFDQYMQENRGKIRAYYDDIQKLAKKKYSKAEPITRIFVMGNPGAGKSSLVQTLKREAFLDSFKRVSESSVPLHTAGIVPSIHTSKHYGRVLFYDFAGDPEYYSSHAAILENFASSSKGDNIFIIVVDLREENAKINGILNYWFSFIQHQKFGGKTPLILIGSHTDVMSKEDTIKKEKNLKRNCAYFLLDCCNPQIGEVQKQILSLTRESPCYKLSHEASMLLALLEKDFSNVTACSIQALLSHIETTGTPLPTRAQSLRSILYELHEIGLLFMINNKNVDKLQVVLNMSQLTNKVHQLLFSTEAERESFVNTSTFNIGVIPLGVLQKVLPEYITKECLVQLQYCQEIGHKDVAAFSSLTQSDSTNQSFLFFPALCSVNKSDVSWVTPPDLNYSIGWLAQCNDSCDYFPPRFLHVLLLRLIFGFTISVPTQNLAVSASPEHHEFQRRCTMWKTGVQWSMEEGVECMVELVCGSREVLVATKSEEDLRENCLSVFNQIIDCVMETKAQFCHSIKPQFFLLDSTNEADFHNRDNLFAMSDVERALTFPTGKETILSVNGKRQMKRNKILCLHKLTNWCSVFPIDSTSVLHYLDSVVEDLHAFGLDLGFSNGVLEALNVNFPYDVEKRREALVRKWMNSSPYLDRYPPCWWHLMEALESVNKSTYSEKIKEEHGVHVQLQGKLLVRRNQSQKPDKEFLESFAGVVGSKWPSLAVSLSLSESEIEEVKGQLLSQQDHALQMLLKWVKREDSTYGRLHQGLKTISLFQYGSE